jgi:predicted dehydrogenase
MKDIVLIGTGPMAIDYANVIKSLKLDFKIIGRGEESANLFHSKIGIQPITGGIELYLSESKVTNQTYAIIATGTENLMPTLKKLLESGVGKILIEKPAALSISELLENESFLNAYADKVFVAYNRRFYSSVIEAKRLLEKDGGLKSMHFEFTEWAHKIEPLQKAPGVKENWFFANSTHVVDLAFYLAGKPIDWKAYSKAGKIEWHNKTNFCGAGITDKGVVFSYLSNWESAGRWALELLTSKRRIYLKPIENIYLQDKGTIELVIHEFDSSTDIQFKPGLFKQVEAFVSDNFDSLLDIKEHIENSKNIYQRIIN